MGGTAGADKGRGGDHRDNGDDGDDGADGEQGDGDTNDDANARTTVVNDVNTESKIPSPSPTSPTPSAVSASASKDPPSPYLRVPDWLSTLPPTTLKVRFSVKAEQQLRSCLPHLQLYDRSNTAQIRKAIVHCLGRCLWFC